MENKSFTVQWHLTSKCTGNCRFCYMLDSPNYQNEMENELSKEQCFKVIEKIVRYLKKNSFSGQFFLTGGDPLAKEGFWEIVEALGKNGMAVSILGNPHLIDQKTARKLKENNIIHYQLSIDGSESTHDYFRGKGSFQKTWKAALDLREQNLSVGISYTVSSANWQEAAGVLELCSQYGINAFRPSRLVPIGKGEKYLKDLVSPFQYREILLDFYSILSGLFYQKKFPVSFPSCDPLKMIALQETPYTLPSYLRETSCVKEGCRGGNVISILPDGTVYSCRRLPITVGNILENSMEEIMGSDLIKKLQNPASFKECSSCRHFAVCGGGCPAVTYAVKGDPFARDPGCWVKNE